MNYLCNFESNQKEKSKPLSEPKVRSQILTTGFHRMLFKQQVDSVQFVRDSYFMDTLILNYNKRVVGKGINCVTNLLAIYFQEGTNKYLYQPGQVQQLDSNDKIPIDLMLVGIEEKNWHLL